MNKVLNIWGLKFYEKERHDLVVGSYQKCSNNFTDCIGLKNIKIFFSSSRRSQIPENPAMKVKFRSLKKEGII